MWCAVMISYTAVILSCLIQQLGCMSLAPVYWNMSNPIFKTSQNDHIIEVQLYDDIDFVCPYYPAAGAPTTRAATPEYYTIYLVKRPDYIHCTLGAESWMKMILNCSEPEKRRRFTILFEPYQSIPRAPEYHPGDRYYFINDTSSADFLQQAFPHFQPLSATSTGNHAGLGNTHHGACIKYNMKLAVQVCCRSETVDKYQVKSNAVDQLLSPAHSRQLMFRDAAVRSSPAVTFIRHSAMRVHTSTVLPLSKSRTYSEKRPDNSLAEDDTYGLRQTGHVVYSSQPSAACSVTSLPLVIISAAITRHLT